MNQWEEFRPGFLEADTVAHCGGCSEGQYANTVDFVDIATGWTEQRGADLQWINSLFLFVSHPEPSFSTVRFSRTLRFLPLEALF